MQCMANLFKKLMGLKPAAGAISSSSWSANVFVWVTRRELSEFKLASFALVTAARANDSLEENNDV